MNRKALQFALACYLLLRVLTTAFLIYASSSFPIKEWPEGHYDPEIVTGLQSQGFVGNNLLLPWYRWDTYHYLIIAQDGYANHLTQTVWPPLYPALINLVMRAGVSPVLSALIVSNLATIVFFYLLYCLVASRWNEQAASQTLLLMALFPSAFFLIAGYSEALFLCFVVACFLAMDRQRWLWAGVMATFACLVRQQGVFLVLPLAWEIGHEFWQERSFTLPKLGSGVLSVTLPCAAFAGFSAFVRFGLNAPWPWVTLSSVWHQRFGFPWEGLIGNITILAGRQVSVPVYPVALVYDLLLGGFVMYGLIRGLRSLPISYQIFGWMMLISATTKIHETAFSLSVSRYSLAVFPAFIALALSSQAKTWRILWLVFSALSLIILLISFYLWGPVN